MTTYPSTGFQVEFFFNFEPAKPSNLYGYKTFDEAAKAADLLQTVSHITSIHIVELTKPSKYGKWITNKTKVK